MLLPFLDNLYGAWFLPQQTFYRLREQPALLWQAVLVVAWVNLVDGGHRLGFAPLLLASSLISGLVGWVTLGLVLSWLSYCLGRDVHLSSLLLLTGFASLPWLFVAPAQSIGGSLGGVLSIMSVGWFLIWEVWATAIALNLPWWRIIGLIPLVFVSVGLGINWLVSSLSVLVTLST
jgi:hypothetical protein